MGYTTEFEGSFSVTPALKPEHAHYLRELARTRRMKRDGAKTASRPDPAREAVGLPVGEEGEYFVGEGGFAGQDRGSDIIDSNQPPKNQPGLWLKWEPNEDGTAIEWNGAEKFYDYIEWLDYLLDNFLRPWGYVLKGEVHWEGEESDDVGVIRVLNNQVYVNEEPPLTEKIAAEL